MAVDTIQPQFRTSAEALGSEQPMLALIMVLLSAFGKEEEGQDFAAILGFGNTDDFTSWRADVKEQGLDAEEAVKTLDVEKIDFQSAAKINIPKAMRETGQPLLDMIAHNESRGNYNVAFGGKTHSFTSMTINDVIAWQKDAVAEGAKSSAVGRYQFMRETLTELRDKLHLTGNETFDESMQNKLALSLLDRRGYSKFLAGKMSEEQFMLNLSKEWAALPKDMNGQSFYAGDGLNKVQTSPEDVLAALRLEKLQAFGENKQAFAALSTPVPEISAQKLTI